MREPLGYKEAVAYLTRAERFGIHPSLDGIRALTGALDRPQDAFRVVQVAGTNGKTSVARMTAALLSVHGCRTGVFTSPHLSSYTEQVAVNGRDLSPEDFAGAASVVREAALSLTGSLAEEPTEFELATAIALVALREAAVEWAVLEVGMGGRWDATSVASPRVAVVTGVGLDHTDRLGPTLEAVADEKAQVIREGSVAVLGPGTVGVKEVFLRRATDVDALVVHVAEKPGAGDVVFEVTGRPKAPDGSTVVNVHTGRDRYTEMAVVAPAYQAANLATAVAAAEEALATRLDEVATRGALHAIRFPGRFEVVARDPIVVVDGAHNPQAARVLAGAIEEAFGEEPPVIVLGILKDKDAVGIVRALTGTAAGFVVTQSVSERALPVREVARVVEDVTGSRPPAADTVAEAVDLARANGDAVVVAGSLTTAAEARRA